MTREALNYHLQNVKYKLRKIQEVKVVRAICFWYCRRHTHSCVSELKRLTDLNLSIYLHHCQVFVFVGTDGTAVMMTLVAVGGVVLIAVAVTVAVACAYVRIKRSVYSTL